MSEQFIFGYGSLVNRATHDYTEIERAELHGWRREWHYTTLRDLAYLSATPDPDGSIIGVTLKAPQNDSKLEDRERAYQRSNVSRQVVRSGTAKIDIEIFAISPALCRPTGPRSALLLSYIDVVVQGFLQEYGEPGVQNFFETTHGWGAPILNDRAAPVYPRHQPLQARETALTDHWLNALSAVVK
ncbi:MAG: gamma-glutamylcyclotransferase family protein [Paracoccaceae bacterium]